jgi:hypothetical protein
MNRLGLLLTFLLLVGPAIDTVASDGDWRTFETDAVRVLYTDGSRLAAERIIAISPRLLRELAAATGMKVDFRPTVIPVVRGDDFQHMGGSRAFIAFALPERLQVVIDLSRFDHGPAILGPVLKHEYAHLLLHRYIPAEGLPRWMDEGIAQHLSDGISEYLPGQRQMILGEALAADRMMPLAALTTRFPRDDFGLQLAYEQSRSFIGYMVKRYGDGVLADLLVHLAAGWSTEESVRAVSGFSLQRLEADWRQQLVSPLAWMGRMAGHAYGILFFLAALATLVGFLRLQRRRRNYVDDEDGLDEER